MDPIMVMKLAYSTLLLKTWQRAFTNHRECENYRDKGIKKLSLIY